ncbi:MAG: tRNA-specific 2-thiouridylase MnmA [Candidatus Tectimicrobiota bacterium]|nr:MAG: tRNA-specific 2-thiouridylase MnmA [Candidatus Tectomicrobia bacterium]
MAERVVVAMSGGVDSAVAAALLQAQGYEVIGITMKLWDGPAGPAAVKICCTLDDVSDARRVAARLGIPFFVVNFKAQFAAHVVDPFVAAYRQGATPIPCTLCNRYLKFTALRQRAQQLGARWIATGHYAGIQRGGDGRYYVQRGIDRAKDQSYFLFNLTQEQLAQTLFPLASYRKSDVRALARQLGLNVADKRESQEICFIPEGDYRAFLRARLQPAAYAPGPIVDRHGRYLGQHQGLPFYTVGQRRGLGIAAPRPLYVTAIDTARNALVVGPREEAMHAAFEVEGVNWMCSPPQQPLHTCVQIRYRHPPVAATVYPQAGECALVVLEEPQFAVTPGQAAVFYAGDTVLGGGWIRRPADPTPRGG